MFCSQLSVLEKITDGETIEKFQNYLASLSENSARNITVSSVSHNIGVCKELAQKMLRTCLEAKILGLEYGLRCPECGQMIKRSQEPLEDLKNIATCYRCEEEIQLDQDDIVAIFVFEGFESPFAKGQQGRLDGKSSGISVAREDSFLQVFDDVYSEVRKENPNRTPMDCAKIVMNVVSPSKDVDPVTLMNKSEKRKMMWRVRTMQILFLIFFLAVLFGFIIITGIIILIVYNADDKVENLQLIFSILEITLFAGVICLLRWIIKNMNMKYRIEKYLFNKNLKQD